MDKHDIGDAIGFSVVGLACVIASLGLIFVLM